MAVESLESVVSVESDMSEHTVTVDFDDDVLTIAEIVQALNNAGYTVPKYNKIE